MNYQEMHIEGTYQKYLAISEYIKKSNKKINTLLDIGCNSGKLLDYFNLDEELNIKTFGIEQNLKYASENIRIIDLNNNNINFIRKHDAVLLLSVFHQFSNDEDQSIKLLKKIRKKAKCIFFFQNPSIIDKFKFKVYFKNNDKKSIINYNMNFLKKVFPEDKINYIGKSELNNKNEKYRYIFAVQREVNEND